MKATDEQDCARCDERIVRGQEIVPSPRGWIHAGCASGADDQ